MRKKIKWLAQYTEINNDQRCGKWWGGWTMTLAIPINRHPTEIKYEIYREFPTKCFMNGVDISG